jgi:RHS repeat-associated protein
MRPSSLTRAGRNAALTVGAVVALSLFSFAPWSTDQHPAQAQDVLAQPKTDSTAPVNPAFLNMFADKAQPITQAPVRPVQGEMPAPAPALVVGGLQTALVATGPTSAEEDAELQAAVRAFTQVPADGAPGQDFATTAKPFQDFLAKHPNSGWAMALQTNLGHGYFNAGYFTRALDAWQQAWTLGKSTKIREAKLIADSAVAELARMHARVGHVEELQKLFAEIGDRTVEDAAAEILIGAREGATVMRTQPEIAFLCGPKALANVLRTQEATADQIKIADEAKSGPRGFTLAQVSALATQAGAAHTLIKRESGQPIPVPSVIHWKLNHYAAITEQRADGYVVQDPTFASGLVLSVDAIDAESSGYFLVPAGAKPTAVPAAADGKDAGAWRTVETASDEAATVYGMGYPADHLATDLTPGSPQTCHALGALQQNQTNARMCASSAHTTLVSLTIRDPHIGYAASKGPAPEVQLTYMQREATLPAGVIPYSNVGQKWMMNRISYITDPANGTSWGTPRRYEVGGGAIDYTSSPYGINGKLVYYRDYWTGDRFSRVPLSGAFTHFELEKPDGSKRIYSHLDGATTGLRKVFLKQEIDPQGNAVTYNYTNLTGTQGSITCTPSCVRLDNITDATGKVTTFSYELPAYPLLVTKVTDPFGRISTLTYDGSARLLSITDPIGIVSTVAYDGGGLVNQLTTPYGVTSYSYGQTTDNLQRWLNITDPLGKVERIEHLRSRLLSMSDTEPAAEVPTGMLTQNNHMQVRNTFIWDRHVADLHGTTDYTKASLTHWTTDSTFTTTLRGLESAKKPLERRVWFNNEGASVSSYSGYFGGGQTKTGRVLDDGTTQLHQSTFSGSGGHIQTGLLLEKTDPLGRKTTYTYGGNNLDVTAIKQQISATPTYATLASFTYNSGHRVLTKTDAAGQVWKYAYNAAGQLIYATNPLNETRFWEYDASARLTRVTVPVSVAHASVVYGTTNLSAATAKSLNYTAACSGVTAPANTNLPISVTDSEGYIKCYQYDALDRITKVKYPDGTTDLYDYTFPSGLSAQPTWTTGAVPTAGTPSLDVWRTTDRQGRVKDYVYDRNRRLIKASETVTVSGTPTTRTTQYSYYANGTLKELTDANGNVTHWDIDIQSRPTAKTYAYGTANAKTESYTYDLAGRLKTRTDARGQTLTYTYNKDDTVASYAYTNAVVATPGASFIYDPWYPRRTSMTDQFGTTTWTYETVGSNGALLPDVEDGPYANDSVTYAYDAAGRANSRTISGTAAETFGYDLLGRMNSHVTALGGFSYGYLGNSGQVSTRTAGSVVTSWGYETNANDRRLLTISTTGAVARNFSYTSNAYQITGTTDTASSTHPWLSQTWSFTHDASNRLLTGNGSIAGSHTYGYDKLDNALTFAGVTGTYNGLNQVSTFNAVAFTYDANGNLSSDGTRTYTYDAADRLKTITQGATTVTFGYDGIGRRLKQTVGATETRYLWCGTTICQQRNGSDTVEKRFYAEGEYVHTGTKKYLTLTDHLGSVRDVIDITGTPTLVGSFDYRPYGEVARSWGTVTTGYTYAGLFAQTNTALLLSITRAYNAAHGRWLNVDPKREKGGVNLYGYANASPIMLFDPQGMEGTPSAPLNGLQLPTTPGFGQTTGNLQCFPGSSDPNCQQSAPETPPQTGTPPIGDAAGEKCPVAGTGMTCEQAFGMVCGLVGACAGTICAPFGPLGVAVCGTGWLGICTTLSNDAFQRCKRLCGPDKST